MTEINFTSTYRIPITQAGVNSAKKAKLKELIQSYPNGLIGNSKVGNARVSMPDSDDENFIRKLKGIGYKIYQKFDGENIPKENIDAFIKEKLDTRNFSQKGKSQKRMSRELKEQRRYERNYTPSRIIEETTTETEQITKPSTENFKPKAQAKLSKEQIRQTQGYIKLKDEYGESFAQAVYFGINK